jgi:hypothetical protein
MKKIMLAVGFYIIVCPFILTIHGLSPTNMAGPGLDIVVYFLSALITVIFLAISLIKITPANKLSYLNVVINVIGAAIITVLLYWEFTKPN